MALPAPNLQGSLCELAALLRIWVLPRLFSCVLHPLLPLSLLSPLHPENLARLPPACALYLQTRKTLMELRGRQRCPHPRLQALQFGSQRLLWDAGTQLRGCFWPSSSPAQEPAVCRGLLRLRPPHTLAAAQKLPRCLTPAQRRGGGGERQLRAAAALHSHTWAGSTPGETVLNCSGLTLGAGSKPPSLKPFLLQLTPRDEEQCVSVKSFNRPQLLPWRQEQTLQTGATGGRQRNSSISERKGLSGAVKQLPAGKLGCSEKARSAPPGP